MLIIPKLANLFVYLISMVVNTSIINKKR